jgi:hypothetical protein
VASLCVGEGVVSVEANSGGTRKLQRLGILFSEGQIVVHPHHGPCTVAGMTTRTIRGVETRYIDLAVHAREMNICVPLANAEEVGLRQVLDAGGWRSCSTSFARPPGTRRAAGPAASRTTWTSCAPVTSS